MYWRKRTGCVGGNGLDVLVAMDWMHDGDGLDARRRRTGCTTETDWMHDGDGLDARRRRTGCTTEIVFRPAAQHFGNKRKQNKDKIAVLFFLNEY